MYFKILMLFVFLLYSLECGSLEEESCSADKISMPCKQSLQINKVSSHLSEKYILYEVNPGEGFNLRRDVYMRMAKLVKKLNENSELYRWILVLPPWGPLYHWKSKSLGFQSQIKWSAFFDISSLSEYVPVMEFEEYLSAHGSEIDVIFYLQHYAEGWENERWEERMDLRDCIEPSPYTQRDGKYIGWFWGFENVTAEEHHCLSVQGYSTTLKSFLSPLKAKSIMIDRAEVILHDSFGDAEYWKVRKSMVFSKELTAIGDSFRKQFLNSNDDTTERCVGGPYVGVHLRRQDFTVSRSKDIPSLKHAAEQILKWMRDLKLDLVFVATDAPESGFSLEHMNRHFLSAFMKKGKFWDFQLT